MENVSKPPKEETPNTRHEWMEIAAGRVCSRCGATQVKGEFKDADPCAGEHPPRAV